MLKYVHFICWKREKAPQSGKQSPGLGLEELRAVRLRHLLCFFGSSFQLYPLFMCFACLVLSFGQELSDLTQIARYYAVASLLISEHSLLRMVRTVNQMEEAEKKKNVLGALNRAHSQRMRGRKDSALGWSVQRWLTGHKPGRCGLWAGSG